jgi:hypothetical protein
MPSSSAERIGPIEGIWQSRFQAWCFLLSASRSAALAGAPSVAHPVDGRRTQPAGALPAHLFARYALITRPCRNQLYL